MLPARSSAECHLYMDLSPCRCGEFDFNPQHWVEQGGDVLVAGYDGACVNCGTSRSFRFQLDPELPPPPPAYGGDAPSRLIDPGQYLWVAEQFASSVPADPQELTEEETWDEAVEALEVAIAALEEVLKFIPSNADAVPEEAFTAPDGWMLYSQEPHRFRRDRLNAVLGAYRASLADYIG